MSRLTPLVAALAALALPAAAEAANDPLRPDQPNLSLIESDGARSNGSIGKGAIVAIVDSGVRRPHPDLQGGRLLQGYDFVQNDSDPQDGDGHGTHVLGIVGAAEGNGVGVSSVAPGARLLPVRVLDDDGAGFTSDVARGIDYAVAQGAHVINLSLGSNLPLVGLLGDGEYDTAIRRALAAGRVVVASSGNNGTPVCEQPSASEGLLCVGSVDDDGIRSSFSSFGGGRGIMAPGNNVLSTYRDDFYTRISGTSQAAPHVAGAAALLVAKGLRGQEVVNRLLRNRAGRGPGGPGLPVRGRHRERAPGGGGLPARWRGRPAPAHPGGLGGPYQAALARPHPPHPQTGHPRSLPCRRDGPLPGERQPRRAPARARLAQGHDRAQLGGHRQAESPRQGPAAPRAAAQEADHAACARHAARLQAAGRRLKLRP